VLVGPAGSGGAAQTKDAKGGGGFLVGERLPVRVRNIDLVTAEIALRHPAIDLVVTLAVILTQKHQGVVPAVAEEPQPPFEQKEKEERDQDQDGPKESRAKARRGRRGRGGAAALVPVMPGHETPVRKEYR